MHDKWWTILIFSSQKYVNLNFIINQMEATRLSSVIWYSVADTIIYTAIHSYRSDIAGLINSPGVTTRVVFGCCCFI